MNPQKDRVVAGKYRLDEQIARGGMGSVWSAYHQKLDARVAVKFMDPELASSDDMRVRFEREAKAAAKLRSPHVVQVLDYGVEDTTPYIVMEYLSGEDLRQRLSRVRKLGLAEASRLLVQASKALRLAATEGIVHRDLKPGNLFLARSGDDETLKILDFGVAKALRPSLGDATTEGLLLGSPHYMSPEQARGHPLDHRSDLFSMAVILFHAITGQRPFRGTDIGDVIVQICSDPIPRASSIAPELPAEIDQFFLRGMARNPDERFQSAREMARSFDEIVSRQLGIGNDTGQMRQRLGSLSPSGATPLPIAHPLAPSPSSQTPRPPVLASSQRKPMPSARGIITGASVALLLLGGGLAYVTLAGSNGAGTSAPQTGASAAATPRDERPASAPEPQPSPDGAGAESSAAPPSTASASSSAEAAPPPIVMPPPPSLAGPRPPAAATQQPPPSQPPTAPAPTTTPKPHPVLGI